MSIHRGIIDCLVIGGGPAGLTAALYLARFLRSVTVIDAQDGRARMIPKTHNLGPFPEGISGRDLLARMTEHARFYGAAIETGTVSTVEKQGELFQISSDRQTVSARSVILATGVFNLRPPLSIPDHDRGLARGLIRYCPVCDAYEVRGKRIAVLGSGAHGLDEASFIRSYAASVTLIPTDGSVAVEKDGIGVLDAPMKGLALSDSQILVTLETGLTEHFDTLYVALGTKARTGLAAGLGCRLTEDGHAVVDARQRTSVRGFHAIGDISDGLDQIGVAIGQGAVAAMTVHTDLPRQKAQT